MKYSKSKKIRNDTELQKKMEAFKAKCRKAGLRLTPQRMAVYNALAESREHPSAEMVYRTVRELFPNVSLDTVYRTLLTLTEIGSAFIVEGSGDAKRFDENMTDHQHFKCLKCKRIIDLFNDPLSEVKVPASLKKYTVLKKTVYFEGICDNCQEGKKKH